MDERGETVGVKYERFASDKEETGTATRHHVHVLNDHNSTNHNNSSDTFRRSKLSRIKSSTTGCCACSNFVIVAAVCIVATVIAAVCIAILFYDQQHLVNQLKELQSQNYQPRTSALTSQPDFRAMNDSLEKLKKENRRLSQAVAGLKSNITSLKSTESKPAGSTYIRWGRSTCNTTTNATLVYSGAGAGATSTSNSEYFKGGGVNYLCLPLDPQYNKWDKSDDGVAFVWLYGAEYRSTAYLNIFDTDIHGGDVPCSLCHVPRSAKVMIPARRDCYDGWTKEYEGYLMSSSGSQHKSTFECVDHEPEAIIPGAQNVTGGALFYFVSAFCGTRASVYDCPPYKSAQEITCVVCTK